jgi:TolB-like protein
MTGRDASAPAPRPVMVVRPFETLGAAPEAKQVAPGLADELIARLAHYDGVTVVAELSAASTLVPTPRCGAIGYVLQGTTRRCGRRLRISAQLLDYADGRYLWVRSFDCVARTKDLWALQEELAGAIAEAVAGPDGALTTLRVR